MKTLVSAFIAVAVLTGVSGCGRLCCRPWFPFLHHACTQGCEGTGIFNWSHCCDTCDSCGQWTGDDIVAETGDAYQPRYAGTPNRPLKHHRTARVKPSSYHRVTRVEPPLADETEVVETMDEEGDVDQVVDETDEVEEVPAKPTTARRVRSSKPRSR